ncbi:transposase domain-containing protein [Streptomyces cyaneofuscatus]|uniref:transposase domain-containing protein n=1 Tax=Streptomyces cyaneofuscatus TaxID=66883 RepID=UPI0034306A79
MSRLERLGLGILTRSCPPELVDRVVAEAGCGEKRRRLLSARTSGRTHHPAGATLVRNLGTSRLGGVRPRRPRRC